MQRILFSVDDDRMTGIRAAGKAHDVFRILRKKIDYLSLSFIAPLRAHNNNVHRFLHSTSPAVYTADCTSIAQDSDSYNFTPS